MYHQSVPSSSTFALIESRPHHNVIHRRLSIASILALGGCCSGARSICRSVVGKLLGETLIVTNEMDWPKSNHPFNLALFPRFEFHHKTHLANLTKHSLKLLLLLLRSFSGELEWEWEDLAGDHK